VALKSTVERLDTTEGSFKFQLNDDEMASFKLAEGIRKFAADLVKLEANIQKQLKEAS